MSSPPAGLVHARSEVLRDIQRKREARERAATPLRIVEGATAAVALSTLALLAPWAADAPGSPAGLLPVAALAPVLALAGVVQAARSFATRHEDGAP